MSHVQFCLIEEDRPIRFSIDRQPTCCGRGPLVPLPHLVENICVSQQIATRFGRPRSDVFALLGSEFICMLLLIRQHCVHFQYFAGLTSAFFWFVLQSSGLAASLGVGVGEKG